MSILITFRTVVAPEYATMTDEQIQTFLDEAAIEITEKVYLKRYNRALCLIAAHLINLSKTNTANGVGAFPLKRTRVGSLEREYAVPTTGVDDSYQMTKYGKEFLRLRKQVLFTPLFI